MPCCRRCGQSCWPDDMVVMPGADKWFTECAEYSNGIHHTDPPLTAAERKFARSSRVCPRCGAHFLSWKEAEKHRC